MNILVIDDEHKTANALKDGLEGNGYQVAVAYDGPSALALVSENDYQLVISDIIMPGMNGVDLCRKIRAIKPATLLLLLTALNSKDDVVDGFEAGADDYLTKPFDFRELLARVKSLTKRTAESAGETIVLRFSDVEMNLISKQVVRAGVPITLTALEFKLLEYFMRRPNVLVSRPELSRDIWNLEFQTGTNIVEVYINYLRNKIDKPFERKLLHNKHGFGYVLKDNDS
ncbi:MAG: response regulator transcription factor [Bacteroidota bacterium]